MNRNVISRFNACQFLILYSISTKRMSLQAQEILRYINLAREYPKYYIGLIEEQLGSFVDDVNMKLQKEVYYETIEGRSAWEQAKTFLNNQEPLRPFDFHPGLASAASDHVKDIVKNNSNGHQGSDGSSFMDRIQRYCKKGKGSMIELLGTTHLIPEKNSIEIALVNLIVDDGVTNRGHRRALFSRDYKYIGASFIQNQGQIFTVIAMTQANLEIIQNPPQSIATSTSHLKTLTQITSEMKENQSITHKSKENCIDAVSSPVKEAKSGVFGVNANQKNKAESVWTLKNVVNEGKVQSIKRVAEENANQVLYAEPSIFKEVNQSVYSNRSETKSTKNNHIEGPSPSTVKSKQDVQGFCGDSRNSITSPSKIIEVPIKQSSSKPVKSSAGSQFQIKQSTISIKNSQQSIKSDTKNKTGTSEGFGISSQVEKFKIKSTLNSPFLKGNTFSGSLGSTCRRVVEKKETMRSWCEDQFMVKEVTTVLKYDDGSIEDFVEKHSVLKNGESLLKEHGL